jgi:hypothetical protein
MALGVERRVRLLERVDSRRRSLGFLFCSPRAGDEEQDEQDDPGQSGHEHDREEEPEKDPDRDQGQSGEKHESHPPTAVVRKRELRRTAEAIAGMSRDITVSVIAKQIGE